MSITAPSRDPRSLAARLALVSTVSLGLVAGPVALAGPASAAGYGDKPDKKIECWVRAHDVDHKEKKADYGRYSKDSADVKFKFSVWCNKKTDVKFDHWIFQKKHGKWVLIKDRHGTINNVKDRVTKHTNAEVKDTGRKGGEEKVFHVVKIKYDDKNGRHSHTVTKYDSAYGTVDFGRY
ncbi:hypothetical protein [Arthrobacter sp. ISL-28]|uniref:hypothetical protein n=1 Tax=Arthrobacter sp. ISL-28 TaxID=2819108 RepID=UPI001BE84113|nr:hypothetical protein [Arthrobacter sp. ISL-28]MBT2519482.1 hypothetical protein [Arthrobacter sp. ISL-28]